MNTSAKHKSTANRARRVRRTGSTAVALALIVAACGGGEDEAASETTITTPTTVAADTEMAEEGSDTAATDDDAGTTDDPMLGAFGPACGAVPTEGEGSFAGMADDPAATAASNNPVLSTLVTAVVEAELVDTLNGDGPFTIFAPTNDAFAAIDEETLGKVLADKDLLTSVLTYHVIGGEQLDASALSSTGSSPTVNGDSVDFRSDGLAVNDANVVCSNVPTANAIVHIIDQVLLPAAAIEALSADAMADGEDAMADGEDAMADGEDAMLGASGPACAAVPTEGEGSFAGMADDPAATAASNNPVLSTLVTAVVEAQLVDTLNGDGPFTIFAPTNDAFGKIPEADLAAVLADKDLLTTVLTLHVVAGDQLSSSELVEAGSVPTVNGADLTIESTGGVITVNGAAVVCMDVPTANATVHIIDSVILPG